MNIFNFTFYLKNDTMKLYFQFSCVAGYWKHNNDILKLNILKYDNYNVI